MTGLSSRAGVNPFVGPRPLETGQRIFGRDREIDELYYLLSAERIVLLHSPSGAGKSSIIRAGLVPRLEQRFDLRGPTRVNTQPPGGATVNRYVLSANLGFEQGLPEDRRRSDDVVSRMTLREYLEGRPRRRSAPKNVVLIFDQFEEILTADPLGFEAKHEFFRQLGELLQDPSIWALFALREDYLAPLDPYADQIPTHLKNRFRVDLLSRVAAQEAMVRTFAEGGRAFARDAAAKLATDLATMQIQQSDGRFEKQVGPYVEPLHLQVVCRGLWERMPADDRSIDLGDIASFGDVTRALATYYEDVVGTMPGAHRAIREWVGEKLITKDAIRSQVLRGVGTSEGLSNELIAGLVNSHLVRAEQRAGAVWYELAHDRLIEPVRTSNEAWFRKNLHPMQRQAILWAHEGKPDRLLLRAQDLAEAEDWASSNAASVRPIEQDLLNRSIGQRWITRIKRGTGVSIVATLMVSAGTVAWVQRARLKEQQTMILERQLNIEALQAKVDSLEQTMGQAGTAQQQELAQVQVLRTTNAGLRDKVATLDGERIRLEAALVALREDNRQLEARLEVYAMERRLLEQRSDTLDQDFDRLLREWNDLNRRVKSLASVPATLAIRAEELRQEVAALSARNDELRGLVWQTEPCKAVEAVWVEQPGASLSSRGAPAASTGSSQAVGPKIPPDPGGSDALRRRIEALARELGALMDERARMQDEARWLQAANRLLEEQRAALEQEVAQVRNIQRVLQARQQALRDTVKHAEAERKSLQDYIATQEKRNADLRAAVEGLAQEHRQLDKQLVYESDQIASLSSQADGLLAENQKLIERMTRVVDRILEAAASPQQAADLAAMLAVKAYRWVPYDADAAAHPAVYNGLWLALRRIDAKAAQALLAPGDPAAGKLATTRSEVMVKALCELADRPFTEDEWRRLMPEGACFTPEVARACRR